MSFRDIANQTEAAAFLKRALAQDRLAHALLFEGPAGSGQREMALELARALFCESASDGEGCGACLQCRQVGSGHPDLWVLEPEEDSQFIKMEQVKHLIHQVSLRPFQAAAKLFLIDPADRLNDVAQNALLKTLEEPPGRSFFVLITANPQALLETVRSRLQSVRFTAVPGSPADPETRRLTEEVLKFILAGAGVPPDVSKMDRPSAVRVLDLLIEDFRGALLVRAGAEVLLDAHADLAQKKEWARAYTEEELGERLEILARAKERLLHNVNHRIVFLSLWDALEAQNAHG